MLRRLGRKEVCVLQMARFCSACFLVDGFKDANSSCGTSDMFASKSGRIRNGDQDASVQVFVLTHVTFIASVEGRSYQQRAGKINFRGLRRVLPTVGGVSFTVRETKVPNLLWAELKQYDNSV